VLSSPLRMAPPPMGQRPMTRRGNTGNHGGDRMGRIIRGNALVTVQTQTS